MQKAKLLGHDVRKIAPGDNNFLSDYLIGIVKSQVKRKDIVSIKH